MGQAQTEEFSSEDNSGFIQTILAPPPPGAYWKPWNLVDLGSEFHFVPSQDKIPHINSSNCDCGPRVKATILDRNRVGHPIFQHLSFDLREVDEWWFHSIQHPELGRRSL